MKLRGSGPEELKYIAIEIWLKIRQSSFPAQMT
jgi:hypothetical protein